jgi:ribosomal protein L20
MGNTRKTPSYHEERARKGWKEGVRSIWVCRIKKKRRKKEKCWNRFYDINTIGVHNNYTCYIG